MMPPDWRPPTFETPRLVLRAFEEADADPLFLLAANPAVTRFTLWEAHQTVADTRVFVCDYARSRYAEGVPEPYAVCLTADRGSPIGAVGVFWASQPNRTMELGYWLGEPFWGAGLMAEACRVVIDHAFASYAPERLQARVIAGNTASARVLEKLGFRPEGTLRAALYHRGRAEDVLFFSRLKAEWAGGAPPATSGGPGRPAPAGQTE
jgi:ribosomal-protein-alanine N-acetyltransferase